MKRRIWTSTIREIKQSFGRYIAILAIVALGVGFFAGLKCTQPVMLATMEEYFDRTQFFDYRMLSSMGYDQEAVEQIAGTEGCRAAEGALSFDIIVSDFEGEIEILKAHSITEDINKIVLVEGRMPQADDECLVDANYYGSKFIGSTLTFTDENTDEDVEHFAYSEYKVVGRCKSPLYVQYERGNTALGDGVLDGFMYLNRSGFADDFFTEIYVKLDEDKPLYSKAADALYDKYDPIYEAVGDEAAAARFERVVADARTELADAKEELEDKEAEAKEELADAKSKLDDGAKELEDAKIELADAKTEIEKNEKKLADAKKELEDARVELDAARILWDNNKVMYDSGEVDNQLQVAASAISQGEEQLAGAKAQLDSSKAQLDATWAQLEGARAQLDNSKTLLDSSKAQLDQLEAAVSMYGDMAPPELLAQYEAGVAQYEAGKAGYEAGVAQYEAGLVAYEAGRSQYEAGLAQYNEASRALSQGHSELATSAGQYYAGRQTLQDMAAVLAENEAKYQEGFEEYQDGVQKLNDGKQKYLDGLREYEDGLKEYEDGLKEYDDALKEFNEEIADAKSKLADAQEELDDLEEAESFVLGRDTNVGYVCFESDSGIVDGISDVFPVFFFLVAALVCVTTMNRMVEEQRTQIGVLKALGYSAATIMGKYMVYSGSAAVFGAALGFAGGTMLFPAAIWYAYGMMYNIGGFVYVFNTPAAVIGIIVALVCSIGTTFLSCRVQLSEMAAELMRPKAPKPGKRIFLEYIPFIWNRLSFLRKVSMRNIFRYKKRFFMMIFGISGCSALLVAGFGIKDSVTNVANQQYANIELHDIGLTLTKAADGEVEVLSDMGYTTDDYLLFYQTTVDMIADGGTKSMYAMVLDDDANLDGFLSLHTDKGEPLPIPGEGEAIINKKMSEHYNIAVGDEICLRDGDMNEMPVKVVGINENYIYNYTYISASTYEKAAGKKAPKKTVYLNAHEGEDQHELSAALMNTGDVAAISINSDLLERVDSMMASMNIIVLLVIISGAGLAFVVLYNLTNINITERIREIATIKVLGFYRREAEQYVFRENILLAIIGAAVGLGLGKLLHGFVMKNLVIDLIFFNSRVSFWSFMYSFGLTVIFAIAVNLFMGPKLDKVSMTESLKSVD